MKLYDYQQKAVDFITAKKRVYLALDMGMGKTITSLASAEQMGDKHIMLVAEKNEIVNSKNFEKEVGTHFEGLNYASLRENDLTGVFEGEGRYVCGINPEGLVKHNPELIVRNFDAMVIDEATLAKTTTTKRFKSIYKIAKGIPHLALLSGTPMMNGAAELYAPLLLLDHPMVAGKGAKARKSFEAVFAGGHYRKIRNTGKWFQDYAWWAKGANNIRELRYLIRGNFFFMQKGETNVFKKKIRTMEWVDMSLPWVAEYTQAWDTYLKDARKRKVDMDNVQELRKIIENGQMYQINSRWKAKKVAEDVASGKYGNKRIVIFSMFIETDKLLQNELSKRNVTFKTFEDLDEWKAGDEQVLVGRIKANSKGGNVPEASVCLFVDMDFVPANNIQAENRIDRPQQKEDMLIVYYMTKGDDVIDAHVRKINQDKIRKINEFMRPLTDQEIAEMPQRLLALRARYPKDAEILGI